MQDRNIITKLWELIEKVIYIVLDTIFCLLGKKMTQEASLAFLQFVKFGIVGMSNVVVSYVIYLVGLTVLRKIEIFAGMDYVIAQIIAFLLSVLWSFYWNNKKVFVLKEGEQRSIWKALLKTYISYSFTGLFLNSILLILWVQIFHISEFVAPIINLIVSVPLNFIFNKFWAFEKTD